MCVCVCVCVVAWCVFANMDYFVTTYPLAREKLLEKSLVLQTVVLCHPRAQIHIHVHVGSRVLRLLRLVVNGQQAGLGCHNLFDFFV